MQYNEDATGNSKSMNSNRSQRDHEEAEIIVSDISNFNEEIQGDVLELEDGMPEELSPGLIKMRSEIFQVQHDKKLNIDRTKSTITGG